jgi:hypothetical protein
MGDDSMERQNRARVLFNAVMPANAGILGGFDGRITASVGWRVLLLGTVAAGALCIAAPRGADAGPGPCIVGPANVVTCSGNQSDGIESGTDFDPVAIDTLNVNNLTQNIAPAAAVSGIFFQRTGALTVNSNTGNSEILVSAGANGISARSTAGGGVTVNHSGNVSGDSGQTGILATSNSNANNTGVVSITSVSDVTGFLAGIVGGSGATNNSAGSVTISSTGTINATTVGIRAESLTVSDGDDASQTASVSNSGNITVGTFGIDALSTVLGNGNAGLATVSSSGNISSGGSGIRAESTVTGNGNAGPVSVDSEGNISADNAINALSRVTGNGNSGTVSVSTSGAIFGQINALSTVVGLGNAGDVSITNNGPVTNQAIGEVGISAISRAQTDGESGAVSIVSFGNVSGGTRGIEAIAQSGGAGLARGVLVGSIGNIIAGNGAGIFADSFAAGANGDASAVEVTSLGNIQAVGDGIEARSRSTGGTAGAVSVGAGGVITSTGSDGILAESQAGGAGNAGDVTIELSARITGALNGIHAISLAPGGVAGNILVDLLEGSVTGGAGAAIRVVGGNNNQVTVGATVSLSSLSDFAIVSDGANEFVQNFGTITGNVDLGGGANAFNNEAGSLFNAGTFVFVGNGNLFQNAGIFAPGGNGTAITTQLTGDVVLQAGGTFAVDVGGGNDRVDVSGTATLGGRVLPIVRGLIGGTQQFTILSAAGGTNINGITVEDTLIFHFELLFPNANDMVLSVTADFTPADANLTPNQRAVAAHLQGVVTVGGGTLGDLIAYLGSFVDPAAFAAALDRLHPEPYLAQLKSVLYASLGFTDAMQSCPVSGGPNVAATLKEGQCAWVRMGGRALEVDRSRENIGFTDKSWGGSAGVQFNLAPNWLASIALGYDRSDIRVDDRAVASGDILQIGAGAKYSTGNWQ